MPQGENTNKVRITIHAQGVTDEKLTALKNNIRRILTEIAGAVMQVQEVETSLPVTGTEPE